ncbi:RNA methyltransferase [Vogesella indigofera]|jgi:tRNA/rRNA methyltransferase|uniref:tRNA (cytidine/uridine-2'-O-)-methyltransferase TrmJ n=1 Tax=Vogesella indigofera TaxID=45465 RepID=A0A495BF07_VOGIN|nr:RNA methyltransferase [Vogesella indigofera]MDC7700783.1 RNA methyltransferase [Vogesella indigofera]MDC7704836.1 RNA methyltransferase [Vogesella indigofera]MDC7706229.1 RNA methyltransferase [Vogesella indigofera]MDC7709999.1 RNA methyltransferase [Vogesella indigofera]RKQ58784.1 tRNA/rRNA methyltransferase [Vogesella indigofera]
MNKPQVPDFLKNIRVVLARPSHPGNIGSAARAMKTMGLTRLYLVEPKAFPHEEANVLASGAVDVVENAIVVSSLAEALADVSVACALTSRRRELSTPLSTPRETAPELMARARDGEQVALVFGNETFGLSIDEVEQCNRLVTVPGNPDYFSLNLAMAVQVMTYELFSHSGVSVDYLKPEDRSATLGEVDSFCGHLEAAMADVGYLEHRNSERLLRRMRTLFHRAALQREEIDILRGFFKQAQRFADGTLPPRKKSGD